jgi:hypothetical protein
MEQWTWWQRLDAEGWVYGIGVAQTILLTLWFLWAAFAGLLAGFAVFALIPATFAALSAGLTAAWRRGTPWSWWAWTLLCAIGAVGNLADLTGPGRPWAPLIGLAVCGGTLALLFHPDCRARIGVPVEDRASSREASGPRAGHD